MTGEMEIRRLGAGEDDAGARIDRWLAETFEDLSRTRCKALIEDGQLAFAGEAMTDPSAKVREGEYALTIPAPVSAIPKPEDIPLEVLYEDDSLIVINKRPGLTVHPAPGAWSGTLVNALLHHCADTLSGIGGVQRPGIVHRLDKDTSGVLVAAKSDAAHQGLSEQFAAHSVKRAYIALARTAPKPREGRIETRIARSRHDRKKMAVMRDAQSEHGKVAVTNYRTLAVFGQEPGAAAGTPAASEVECRLETGRTHQIRVHLTHVGCPILGDATYGRQATLKKIATPQGEVLKDFRRQALHAAILGFEHPISGETLRFETPLPKDMQRLRKFLERL